MGLVGKIIAYVEYNYLNNSQFLSDNYVKPD